MARLCRVCHCYQQKALFVARCQVTALLPTEPTLRSIVAELVVIYQLETCQIDDDVAKKGLPQDWLQGHIRPTKKKWVCQEVALDNS